MTASINSCEAQPTINDGLASVTPTVQHKTGNKPDSKNTTWINITMDDFTELKSAPSPYCQAQGRNNWICCKAAQALNICFLYSDFSELTWFGFTCCRTRLYNSLQPGSTIRSSLEGIVEGCKIRSSLWSYNLSHNIQVGTSAISIFIKLFCETLHNFLLLLLSWYNWSDSNLTNKLRKCASYWNNEVKITAVKWARLRRMKIWWFWDSLAALLSASRKSGAQ